MLRSASLPAAVLILVVGASAPARAHDLWLERDGDGLTLRQGHRHAGHGGEKSVPYDPAAVKEVLCLEASGALKPQRPGAGYPLRMTASCDAALVSLSTGYWTKTPWETKNLPKTGIPGAVKSWLSQESVKRIERWSAASARPLTPGLEITPLTNPFRLDHGARLSLRVTMGGAPRSGVAVSYDGKARGTTGGDGVIALRLRHGGTQIFSASLEEPLADGKADTVIRAATLHFDLAAK